MRAAIIVPIYGQAELLGEAIDTLLSQQTAGAFAIVLVDDRCTDPRTARKAAILAAAHPGRVFYLRATENRGLSAMRNAGIRRALAFWPDLEAFAFVDGDDKVFAKYVARGLALLRSHGGVPAPGGGRVGWIYEDWQQFGTPENLHSPAPFNPLFALAGCQHTPGAFCLAEMFRDGLRFDERRRGGDAEDWQFWVNAYAQGWRGRHTDQLGFRYRRRVGGLAFEGLQAAERNRVLIQKEFAGLYHPDHYQSHETGLNARCLVFDAEGRIAAGTVGRTQLRLGTAALGDLLARLAQLPTTIAPAHALFFTGDARETLTDAGLLDWAAWFVEPRDKGNIAALSVRRNMSGGATLNDCADRQSPGGAAVISLPLVTLARAVSRGAALSDLLTPGNFRHHQVTLETDAAPATAGATLADHDAQLAAAMAPLDQPGHIWHRDSTWHPLGAGRAQLDRLHLGFAAPLPDPQARHASLIVASEQDLAWRAEDLDIGPLAAHLARRDGIAPSLCVIGTRIPPGPLRGPRFRSIFLLPEAAARGQAATRLEPEGILTAFGTVVSLDCVEIIPALNNIRRFGCATVAALPRRNLNRANLAHVLLNSFKAFSRVMIRAEDQYAAMLALGCARETVSRELLQPENAMTMETA